jgi:ChrR Cupin-like domain
LASRYVDVDQLPWTPTRFAGIDVKILMQDEATGLLTALTRFAPGRPWSPLDAPGPPWAVLPDYEHVELEQTYVLEGSLVDQDGIASVGTYVWRPAGSSHDAHAPEGCIALSFFLRPNKSFDTL